MDGTRSAVTPKLVLGVMVLALGVLLTMDNLGLIDAGSFFDYWPLILVAVGIVRVMQPQGRSFGIFLILFGGLMLLRTLDIFHWRLRELWPLLLVVLGASLLWQALSSGRPPAGDGADVVSAVAILGGCERRVTSTDFRGGEATAMLGGCKIDLRGAAVPGQVAVIDTFAFWGGVEIVVPDDWSVELRGAGILGAFEDKSRARTTPTVATLVVKGVAIMGGVEIKS